MKAVLTGATSGIGYEILKLLCEKENAEVLGVGRNEERLRELSLSFKGCLNTVRADLSNLNDINYIVEAAKAQLGGIDLLVNNAGFGFYKKVTEHKEEEVLSMAAVNFAAPLILTNKLLDIMKENSSIVFVITSAVHVVVRSLPVYGATKVSLHYAVRALREELKYRKINVIAVYPGAVRTEFHKRAGKEISSGVSADVVAREILKAVKKGKKEVYIPRYLAVAKWLSCLLPPIDFP